MNRIDKSLLEKISALHNISLGAVNIRKNGEVVKRENSAEIEIVPKKNKSGIDVFIKPNVKNKAVHIPVIITEGGIDDLVLNDFFVGVQFHPEFKSRPNKAHPLFKGLVSAALQQKENSLSKDQ